MKGGKEKESSMDVFKNTIDTKKRQITLINALRHRDFINNIVLGITQANCALLVVSCAIG